MYKVCITKSVSQTINILLIDLLQEDAERLLKNCKRYDLLNEFYQSIGEWKKALETAEMYDRIHLRTTYYNFAKHLEMKGDYSEAIPKWVLVMNIWIHILVYTCTWRWKSLSNA